ncbi:hypothetical protein GCM10027084_15130 [Pseudoxanthomonas sangjuensis]
MKALFATMLLLAGMTRLAPAAAAQPVAVSPLLGSWSVDVSRLPVPPEARPKSVVITFRDVGGGNWEAQVDIAGNDGTKRHSEGTAALDGAPVPVRESDEADIFALQLPAPNVLVMHLGKGGIPASTRIYTVAADGTTMIETVAYFDRDGKPVLRTNHFTRVP